MLPTIDTEKEPEMCLKSNAFINQAFQGMRSILDIQKTVLESPFDYRDYGIWNIGCNACNYLDLDASPAVEVRHGFKSYTTAGKKQKPILHDLSMTVKKGSIYALLGSSGCGKTTLLSCIVGLKNLDSGEVLISGRKNGPSQCSVPGKGVGWMPQEIALYGDFTIGETINYFGKLNGMKDQQLESSRQFLTDLLSLPEQSRKVKNLSGGQQRRVSMAVTLVHAPPLIILDEPTVGVDPLLRETIWKHLNGLVQNNKATVIVTTHYIEEAAHSNMVGVMRGGRLILEKSPSDLYLEYGTNNLQEIILKKCHEDEESSMGRERSRSSGNIMTIEVAKDDETEVVGSKTAACNQEIKFCINTQAIKNSLQRIKSLSEKNFYVMSRNLLLIIFAIVMPALQIVLMGLSMGSDPKPLKVGFVTNESCEFIQDTYTIRNPVEDDFACQVANLSCRFLSNLPSNIVELVYYENSEQALLDVQLGKTRGFMTFPENYSDFMFERSNARLEVDNATLIGSTISFEMDASNAVMTQTLKRIMYETYSKFVKGMLSDCQLNPELGGIPIKFEKPVYGDYDMELQQFVAAGMLVGVALFFPLASSTITFLWDKKQGTMERAKVAGTFTHEILASYFLSEGSVLLLQTSLCLLIFVYVFDVTIVGSVGLAFSLVTLNGFAGISLGLLLASICREEIEAILLAIALMMPNFFLCGSMWPKEAMPSFLQTFSYILPGTLGNEAFRSIVIRGWGFSSPAVWSGFLSTFLWICSYWIINIYVHKFSASKK